MPAPYFPAESIATGDGIFSIQVFTRSCLDASDISTNKLPRQVVPKTTGGMERSVRPSLRRWDCIRLIEGLAGWEMFTSLSWLGLRLRSRHFNDSLNHSCFRFDELIKIVRNGIKGCSMGNPRIRFDHALFNQLDDSCEIGRECIARG